MGPDCCLRVSLSCGIVARGDKTTRLGKPALFVHGNPCARTQLLALRQHAQRLDAPVAEQDRDAASVDAFGHLFQSRGEIKARATARLRVSVIGSRQAKNRPWPGWVSEYSKRVAVAPISSTTVQSIRFVLARIW